MANQYSGQLTESIADTEFVIAAFEWDSGAFIGSVTQAAGAYVIDAGAFTGNALIVAHPNVGPAWQASTAYAVGDRAAPVDTGAVDYYFECTAAGTSGGAEPAWNTGGATTDGGVTWSPVDQLVRPLARGPVPVQVV